MRGLLSISNDGKPTLESLQQVWKDWDIQLTVVLSFIIQVFLLLTGRLRRRRINGFLRVLIWLAYVAADFVAVYALGLFFQYEEKYKLGRHSFGDTSPFLWVPFLLVHLGGQDSITAFSLEDNNLWLRHLLNLGVQVILAMAVFWKSFHKISSNVLIPASFVFVSGIIKYGERTWALRTGSRDGLGKSSMKQPPVQTNPNDDICYSSVRASYALKIVHYAQGLFVGRTMLQLGHGAPENFKRHFETHGKVEEKLKIVLMELGMMFDLLYTKAMVLQRLTGRIFRFISQISMVVAFVLFLQAERQAHGRSRANTAISYTLFIGAIIMEVCSLAMEIASPWARAHLKEGAFVQLLSSGSKALSHIKSILQCNNKMRWLPSDYAIGQFDHIEHSTTYNTEFTFTCTVISAFRLEKQWTSLRYVKRVEAHGIARYLVEWFDRSPEERFRPLRLGRRLNYTLCLPFEHALYRLHIYTDYHISRHFEGPDRSNHADADDVKQLKEQCENLADYMSYLKLEYPSMLPVSSVVRDGKLHAPGAGRRKEKIPRQSSLESHAKGLVNPSEPESDCPFEPAGESEEDLRESLEEIREMWTRLLVYAAGKCSGELHARQLGKGGELLTFVWLLMLHHGLGDAATEVKLLTSDDPNIAELGSVVVHEGANFGPRPEQPHYAFDFRRRRSRQFDERQLLQYARTMEHVVPNVLAQGMMQNGQQLIGQLIRQLVAREAEDNNEEASGRGASPETEQLQLARQIQHTLPQLLAQMIQVYAAELIGQINQQLLSIEQDATTSEEEQEDDEADRDNSGEQVVVALEVEQQQHQAAPED